MRRARVSVAVVFALNGFLAAMWVAHIPAISERTGVGHEQLGGLLLLLGGSAFVGMQLCGPLIDRFGSAPLTIVAAMSLSAAVVTPVLASNGPQLALALAAFGFANGGLDVSMNAQAVAVERRYRRPIMAAFHGYFSVGSLIGSAIVAAALALDIRVVVTVATAAVVGVLVIVTVGGGLLRAARPAGTAAADGPAADAAATAGDRWWSGVDLRRLALLAAVAFALMLAEGTAYDWSALHVVETFDTPEATGAISFGAFSAAMALARFGVDRVAARIGSVMVLRGGSLIGLVGMLGAILAPSAGWAIAGWAVFGIGLAGLIPQIFTAAGNLTVASSGRTISLVVGCGYLGMLAGPAVVGFISSRSTLGTGLIAAVAALVFAAVAASVVRENSRHDHRGREPGQGRDAGHATLEG
ncbi:MFS transporter [Gordonia sp. ABSL1-1]|uniref:MFS transporter n=1 Tax=Gordonia sp. ABSL1-1 TaxID=3053923 RepID=UPI0025732018|nr:MFS transporter [Gordonia sp. ABSL1-1]MDL9938785.1 MFS transporter [Gordonia sp. ABSL1-1]